MNDWEKDLKIYRLEQAPPKYENYQEYFERYFAENDETYLAWFLHYYEKELNTKARGFVNEYAMYGHFVDLKQAYVMGMMEVAVDGTSQTEELYFRIEKAEEVMSTFESLNYRERAIVADHLGFCRDCYTTHYYDENDLDSEGKPKRKPRRKGPFIELAVEHGLASPDTADRTYRKALQKMHQKLSK